MDDPQRWGPDVSETITTTSGLQRIGLEHRGRVYRNLTAAELIEHAIRRDEGVLAANGAFVTRTGSRTGRSPRDKFLVRDPQCEADIDWGKVNVPVEPEVFERLRQRVYDYLADRDVYVQELYAGADPRYRIGVQIVTEYAWHSLFARQLFVRPAPDDDEPHADCEPFTVISAPGCLARGKDDGLNSEVFVLVSFARRLVLIGGTAYAGEIKKSIFTVMNYLLPKQGILSMHCSANVGQAGDVALFFGLSGTGKTTLSADPQRRLIGDDEHGWTDDGVFNIEGGCYAKVIRLSEEYEPQIYHAIRFGSVLENVVLHERTREPDYDDDSITENTRAAYPLHYIDNALEPSVAGHPRSIVFLTCDAFGVLPPISRLTPEQAMYQFLSGYTAKVAGTEAGVTEPQATFSTCFGAPFLPLRPTAYAELLGEKMRRHKARAWLINTGWTGGPYGVGQRMKLPYTRAMVAAALRGDLDDVEYRKHPIFGLEFPTRCPDVPSEVLDPQSTWADKQAYEAKARELAAMFAENFKRFESDPLARKLLADHPQG